MKDLTHDGIGEIVSRKLKSKGYDVAFSNMIDAGIGEQPDCLGINIYGETILIEVKVSRPDFLQDKKKPWRKDGKGIGKHRVYVTPVGLLKPEEIQYGWQLWEVSNNKSNSIKVIKGSIKKTVIDKSRSYWPITEIQYRNMGKDEFNFFSETDDARIVLMMMVKIFRRMKASGVDINSFSKGGQLYNK